MIYHKDCVEGMKLIDDNSIDCCITDCPYKIIAGGVRLVDQGDECSGVLRKRDYSKTDHGGVLGRGKQFVSDGTACSNKRLKKGVDGIPSAVKGGKMFNHNDISFSDWLPDLFRIMKPGSHTYIMINGRNLKDLQVECEKVGFKYQNLLVWNKGNVTPNKYYMQGVEFILMLRKGPARNINMLGSKNIINIPNIIGKKKHPTEKPVELYEYFLLNSTNEGDTVIDPFAGCGPIVTSAKNNNRKYIGFEIDEEYYEITKTL